MTLPSTSDNGYVAAPRKEQETGCQLLLLLGFQQCIGYLLAQLVHLLYNVQVKFDYFIRNLETLGKLTTGLVVVLLHGSLQGLIFQDL